MAKLDLNPGETMIGSGQMPPPCCPMGGIF